MDFQELNEQCKKEENVINLKYTENEDEREDKESGKKRKVFSFDSPISTHANNSSLNIDNDFMERVLNDEDFNPQNIVKFNSQNTDGNISCNQRRILIEQQNNELFQGKKESVTPQTISSRTNLGTFHDEIETLRQVIQDMKDPKERTKMCLIERERSTIEELLRDINEGNEQTNPYRSKYMRHRNQARNRGTIETPSQQQQLQLRLRNCNQSENISQQDFEKNSEKQSQLRIYRDPSNRDTSNNDSTNFNIKSQSPIQGNDYLSDRQKFGSGDSGLNNTQCQIQNEKADQKTVTRPFVLGKSCFYKEQDELDSRGQVIPYNMINSTNLVKSAPLDQQQGRMQFNRDALKQLSVGLKKGNEERDSQMLTSIRIEHPVSDSTQMFLPTFKPLNIKSQIAEEREEYTLNSQIKDVSSKFFNNEIFLDSSREGTEAYKSQTEFSKSDHDINKSDNDKKEADAEELHIYTPFLGKRIDSIKIQSPETKFQLNDLEKTASPRQKKFGQEIKTSGEKVMFNLYGDLASTNKINEKQGKKIIELGELHSASQQISQQQSDNNQRRQSSLDRNAAQSSYPTTTPFNPINTNQKLSSSFKSQKQSISKQSLSIENHQKTQKTIGYSQNDDENIDTVQTSLGAQIKQQQKFNPNKNRMYRSNTVFYDQEKKKNLYMKSEDINTSHNHVIQNDQPQEGCPACDFQKIMKISNNQKEKQDTSDTVDQKIIFKEVPLYAIENNFFIKKVSLLNQNNNEAIHNTDNVFILGNKNAKDLTQVRVYFFGQEDLFLDFKMNVLNTTIQSFVKFAIQCYKIKANLNQNLLKYPDQPWRYKIFPNVGEEISEKYKPNMDIPEPSDNMMMNEVLEDSYGETCCFVEIDDMMESNSLTQIEFGQQDFDEFQSVYDKFGQFVFKVEFKEEEEDKKFYSFLRLDKDKKVEDVFEELFKKKKIEIDKKNFKIQGKIIGSDNPLELDLTIPLKIIKDSCLTLMKRDYEDRQDGTLEKKSIINTNNNLFNIYDSKVQKSDFDDEDEDDDEMDYQNQYNYVNSSQRSQAIKAAKLFAKQHPLDPVQIQKYEEFEVVKQSINNNNKQSKRIIGIDGDYIYNRKIQSNLFSLKGILCFLFPSSPNETKCPKKRIDDIKFMCVVEGGTLHIQFYEGDNKIKQWLLYNPDPFVSKRMYQKLQYLSKSEVRLG